MPGPFHQMFNLTNFDPHLPSVIVWSRMRIHMVGRVTQLARMNSAVEVAETRYLLKLGGF